jgi:segregation and condensation protein A
LAYQVKLDVFEGPLDLHLHHIQKAQIDIYDIPISQITDQYIAYIRAMEEFDLEIVSEFVMYAATLLSIKVRMLLPKPRATGAQDEAGQDPRAELVSALLEYGVFRTAALVLGRAEEEMSLKWSRPAGPEEKRWDEGGPVKATLLDLIGAMRDLLATKEPVAPVEIQLERFGLRAAFFRVLRTIRRSEGRRASFSDFIRGLKTRSQAVMVFLALLELCRQGRVGLSQDGLFSDIAVLGFGRSAD